MVAVVVGVGPEPSIPQRNEKSQNNEFFARPHRHLGILAGLSTLRPGVMSSSVCIQCGVVSATLLPSGLCPTCHERSDQTRVAELDRPTVESTVDWGTVTHGPTSDTHTYTPDPRSAPASVGAKYLLGRKIGFGGMGDVFEAVERSTGRTVAIKQLKPDSFQPSAFERFTTEARSLANLSHPNLVLVYEFLDDPRDPQLVMERVDGATLSESLGDRPLDPDTAARLIADAARGVQAAHEKKILHRDLKPSNMLLTKGGVIKVSDFGLAKRLDEEDGNTATGQLVGGTPGFMAPEQVDTDAGPYGPYTDVWGLGATLYYALSKKTPFPSKKKSLTRVLSDPLVPVRSENRAVPPVLDAIVCKCLEKEPCRRYRTAGELADDLDKFRRGESTVAKPLTWRQRVQQRVRRTPRGTITAWALAAVAVLGAGILIPLLRREPVVPVTEPKPTLKPGKEVVFVEDGKFLVEPEWLLGDAVLNKPTADEPYSSFASRMKTMLTVMAKPDTDRYRISARLKQLPVTAEVVAPVANVNVEQVGVFWGYRHSEFRDGVKVKAHLAVGYTDYQPDPANLRASYLKLWHMAQVEDPAKTQNAVTPTTHTGHNLPLEVIRTLPGPSRDLVIDVTPDWIAFQVGTTRKQVERAVIFKECESLNRDLQTLSGKPTLDVQTWSPRSPVGVFADRTRVAIERFAITPLLPE